MSALPSTLTVAKALQDCAVAWLEAGTEFAGVPIVGRRQTNIANDIEAAIAELGACVYVMPGLPVHFIDATPPYADRYNLRVRAIELAAINTTLPDVYELVEMIVRRMFGKEFAAISAMNPLVMIEGSPVVDQSDGERLLFDVIFQTSLGYLPRVETCPIRP